MLWLFLVALLLQGGTCVQLACRFEFGDIENQSKDSQHPVVLADAAFSNQFTIQDLHNEFRVTMKNTQLFIIANGRVIREYNARNLLFEQKLDVREGDMLVVIWPRAGESIRARTVLNILGQDSGRILRELDLKSYVAGFRIAARHVRYPIKPAIPAVRLPSLLPSKLPNLKWGPCNNCYETYSCQQSYMEAPSSYHEPSKNIRIFVRKFKHSPKAVEKNHFIFLNGGPGGYGDQDYWGEIKTLLNGNNGAVCYTMDHRGAGFSEMATSLPLEDVVERFETFARQAPFPVKHLTMTNAALDVAMFVKSIQAATSPKSTNLYAISYGAELAHHVVQLCPDLIDHAFLAGMPSLPNNRHSPDSGIIQACEMDPTCRRYFGNVAQTIPLILDRIADATTNFCTAQLSRLVKGFNTGNRIEIGRSVFRQVLQKFRKFGHIAKYEPIMGALLFLKATSDCRRPDQYESLLKWLWKEPPMNGRGPSDRRESADWVYLMINYDVDVAKIHKDLADNQPKLLGRAYTSCRMPAYFDRIKHHFKHWQRSKVTSIKTTKTHLHYMHGLLDIPTPVEPAFERYQQDVAPVKSWLLLDYRGHDGCPQKCLDLWIQTAFADKDMSVVKECIIRDKKQYELDWSLKTLAEGWRIIDQISEAPKPASRPTSLRIPYYMQSVQPDL